jgi:hypothetical protein
MWFGMTTNLSRDTYGRWLAMSSQQPCAIIPRWDNLTASSATVPNTHARSLVQIVMKYAPSHL